MKKWLPCLLLLLCSSLAFAQLNDAELTQIQGSICTGQQTVTATLSNSGSNSLQTVSVAWSVSTNGGSYISQPTVNLSPALSSGSQTTVTLGSLSYVAGTNYAIKAHTFNPNSTTDSDPSNDSSNTTALARMSGTYTLGGSSPDFATWKAMETALNTWGVCGPVRIEVRQGNYQEQIHLKNIPGSSALNPIKIVAAPGNTAPARLTHYAATLGGNYTLKLEGLSYLTVDSLTLEATDANFGRVIVLEGRNDNIAITHDSLLGTPATNVGSDQAIIYNTSASHRVTNSRIEHNYFHRGSHGVFIIGDKNNPVDSNNLIAHNNFENFVKYAVYFAYTAAISVEDNRMYSTNVTYSPGAVGAFDSDTFRIARNYIVVDGYQGRGINIARCNGTANHPVSVENNSISIVGNSVYFTNGIVAYDGTYNRFVYNSVLISSGGRWSAGMQFSFKSGSHATILNNSFVNLRRGYALDARSHAGLDTSDYNNLYTNGFNIGHYSNVIYTNYIAGLSDYRTHTGQEANSISEDPGHKSIIDLRSKSSKFDEGAIPVNGITTDLTGLIRNTQLPDIGAYEFNRMPDDIAVIRLISPFDKGCGDPNQEVKVVVKNVGKNTQTNIRVSGQVSGLVTATFLDSVATLLPDQTDTLRLGYINTAAGGVVYLVAYSQLSNDADRSDDTLRVDSINLLPYPNTPVVPNVTACAHQDTFMVASGTNGAKTRWYADSANTIVVHEGDTLPLLNPTQNDTFYIESFNEIKSRVGPVNYLIGTHLFESDVANGYEFDAHEDIILDSVTMFPQDTAGTIHIEVTYGNQMIDSITISYTGYHSVWGMQLHLGLEVPQGVGYLITAKGSLCGGLKRNTDGFQYPYTEKENLMTITKGSNTITCKPFGSFNFFYDMVIKKTGCVQSEQTKALLIVKPAPQAFFNPLHDICEDGSSFPLIQGSSQPSGISQQYFGPGVSNGRFDPLLAGVGAHTLGFAVDWNGCRDTALRTIRVHRLPYVSLQILKDLCENDSPYTLITGNPSGGTYSGAGISGNQFDPSVSGIGTFPIIYRYTDTNQCSSADTSDMVVHANPQVQVGPFPTICESADTITLSSGNPGGGTYAGTGVSGVQFAPGTAGSGKHVIRYSYTDNNQCSAEASDTLHVASDPTFDLGPDTTSCLNASVTFQAPLAGMQYRWSNGATTRSITLNQPGPVQLTITDPGTSAKCTYSDSLHFYQEGICLGVEESFAKSFDWKVFPNPATDEVHIHFDSPLEEEGMLFLYNAQGQAVWSQNIQLGRTKEVSFSVVELAAGMYQLKVQATSGSVSQRLYVQ